MAGIKYNESQIKELKSNKYVKNVTQKSITFRLECKKEAIKLSKKYLISKEIFRKLGFPEYIINSKIPDKSLDRWKRKVKIKGIFEERKGKPRTEKIDFDNMTLEQENEYLRTKLSLYEEIAEYIKSGLP